MRKFIIIITAVSALAVGCGGTTSTPDSRDYPQWAREAYMGECLEAGKQSYCLCALNKIEERYSLGEIDRMTNARLDDVATQAAEDCL